MLMICYIDVCLTGMNSKGILKMYRKPLLGNSLLLAGPVFAGQVHLQQWPDIWAGSLPFVQMISRHRLSQIGDGQNHDHC